jgi:hypothetical protein
MGIMAKFLQHSLWYANDLLQNIKELKTLRSVHNIDVMLILKRKQAGIAVTKMYGYSDASQNSPQATNFSYIKQYANQSGLRNSTLGYGLHFQHR